MKNVNKHVIITHFGETLLLFSFEMTQLKKKEHLTWNKLFVTVSQISWFHPQQRHDLAQHTIRFAEANFSFDFTLTPRRSTDGDTCVVPVVFSHFGNSPHDFHWETSKSQGKCQTFQWNSWIGSVHTLFASKCLSFVYEQQPSWMKVVQDFQTSKEHISVLLSYSIENCLNWTDKWKNF